MQVEASASDEESVNKSVLLISMVQLMGKRRWSLEEVQRMGIHLHPADIEDSQHQIILESWTVT
jgi:ribosomal protein L16 Arg81 hydroxylase